MSEIRYLTSTEQMQANYEKYKENFVDANAELVNSQTFLNLLVAEMTNQDPMEPTSNTEFVTQMAQFTQLQYSQDSSKYAMSNYAASLVGKTVTASKMDGAELVTKTGVVEQVVKNGDAFTVIVGGETFELSKITSVSTNTTSASDTLSGNVLGDSISRASMMIGMYATVNAQTSTGGVLDAGFIESIEVKNGEINAIINGIGYKLSDIIEVKYGEVINDGTDTVDPIAPEEPKDAAGSNETDTVTEEAVTEEEEVAAEEEIEEEEEVLDEELEEVTEEAEPDRTDEEDVPDLSDLVEIDYAVPRE